MSETESLNPKEIGKFLSYVAGVMSYGADLQKIKSKDMAPQLEAGIALGLLLAKKQPELVDACVQYWSFTRDTDPDEYVASTLKMYRVVRDKIKEEE